MTATRTIWRWMRDHTIETTRMGQRCDWVTRDHVYVTLGWVKTL